MAETGTAPDHAVSGDAAPADAAPDEIRSGDAAAGGTPDEIRPGDAAPADATASSGPPDATASPVVPDTTVPRLSLTRAAVAGVLAAGAGAAGIGGLSLLLGVRLPFLAVVVGGLIGAVVTGAGRRHGRTLAAVAAVLAILAAAAGELFSAAVVVAQSAQQVGFGVRWVDVLTQIGPRALLQTDLSLHKSVLLFWALGAAVAGYLGYAGLRAAPEPEPDESPDVAPDTVAAASELTASPTRDEITAG